MSTTNRRVESAQAGRVLNARVGMFVGHMAFRSVGIHDMTGGADGEDRPTFDYLFQTPFPITFTGDFDFTFGSR